MPSTTGVQISITHADVNGGAILRIDDGGNNNIEKLEVGALDFSRTIKERTGLGLEWKARVVQGLKDLADVEIKAYADFGVTPAADIKIASIFKALFDSDEAFTLTVLYATGISVAADFLCQGHSLPTEVDDLVMSSMKVQFAGGAPTFTGI